MNQDKSLMLMVAITCGITVGSLLGNMISAIMYEIKEFLERRKSK